MRLNIFGTVCMTALVAGGASAETLTMAHGLPPTHLYATHGMTPFKQCVEQTTNGGLTIEEYGAGQLVTLQNTIDALKDGVTDITNVVTSYESGKLPIANALLMPGQSPLGVQMQEAHREILNQPDNPATKEWSDLGLVPLTSIIGGGYQLMTTGAPVDTMDKLAGLKVRAGGGVQVLTLQAIGATPIDMVIGDLYVAMQRGTVDGTILGQENGPAYKLQELVKSASMNGALGYGQSIIAMTRAKLDSLSPEHKQAVIDCGLKVEIDVNAHIDNVVKSVREDWTAKGVTFYDFPPDMLAELNARAGTVADQYIKDLEARGVVGAREAFDSFQAAQKN